MIEVGIPQDIREYEPTLIAWFTTRQVVCGIVAAVLIYAGYFLEKAVGIEDPLNQPLFLILAIPPILIGWFRPYGMHLEDFIFKAINDNYIAKKNRPYVVENVWNEIIKKEQEEERKEELRSGGRQQKEQFKELPKSKLPKSLKPYK